MYREALREEISQGDVFSRIPFVEADEENERRVVLLTHDCQFDKPNTIFVLTAWVRALVDLNEGTQANVRAGKVKSSIYLPETEQWSECFIDLTHIAPVRKATLIETAAAGGRIASMSDEGRAALAFRIAIFFSR